MLLSSRADASGELSTIYREDERHTIPDYRIAAGNRRLATGPDHQQELECIRRFGREVIPAFRTQDHAA